MSIPRQSDSPLPRKKLQNRASTDRFQPLRRALQLAFLGLNLLLGLEFFLWVHAIESGTTPSFSRPAGVEGWLPIAGLMNSKLFFMTGSIPAIHPAAMLLFLCFALISLLLKKAFCSWLCPVGTLSEILSHLGKKLFGRNLRLPRWLDLPLRALKYILLGFFFLIVCTMSVAALADFLQSPYGLIADVKMLNFFRHMSQTAMLVLLLLGLLSLLVENFWCRYLCPYGALMGLLSLASPFKIRRSAPACIDCGKCATHCPAGLPVDKLVQIRSAECTACMECISACPSADALHFALPIRQSATPKKPRNLTAPQLLGLILGLFFAVVLYGRLSHHWQTPIPDSVYRELIPEADTLAHPGMK